MSDAHELLAEGLGVTAIAAVALFGVGVVSAVQGQRHIEAHPDMTAAVCLGNATEAQAEEVDHKANQSVSSRRMATCAE